MPEETLGLTTRDADEQNDGAGYFECNIHQCPMIKKHKNRPSLAISES